MLEVGRFIGTKGSSFGISGCTFPGEFCQKTLVCIEVSPATWLTALGPGIEVIFPKGAGAAPGTSATAGLVAVPPEEKKEKGQKRNREERPPPEPRVYEPQAGKPAQMEHEFARTFSMSQWRQFVKGLRV